MSNDPPAATHDETWSQTADLPESDALDQDYHAAEWSYHPAAYALLEEAAAYRPDEPATDRNGHGVHLRERGAAEPASEAWTEAPGPVAKMAPRPNLRMAGRRPGDSPVDTESKILAVSAQLQELLEQRKEEADLGLLPSAAQGKRTGFKPAGATQTGSRLPVAPPISLPVRPHRPLRDSGWPGLGRARAQWKRPLVFTVLTAAVVAGSFWVGRLSNSQGLAPGSGRGAAPAPAPAAENFPWSEANLKTLSQALAADHAGQLEEATRMMETAVTKRQAPFGSMGYVANLKTRLGLVGEARETLDRAPDLGTVEGIEQMGFIYARSRDFAKAAEWLERAVVLNPLSGDNFYRLGEALRRKGNFVDAVTRFEEALVRVPPEVEFSEQREMIAFKMRLAEIEGGRRADVLPELETQMKSPAPSGYWALTAAAAALQDRDVKTAANWFMKAKGILGEDRFNALLNDYFFRAFADRPEVSWYFASTESARRRKNISPNSFFVDP